MCCLLSFLRLAAADEPEPCAGPSERPIIVCVIWLHTRWPLKFALRFSSVEKSIKDWIYQIQGVFEYDYSQERTITFYPLVFLF